MPTALTPVPGVCPHPRYLFDALLPLPPGTLPPAASRPALLSCLAATAALLDAEPRLLGVLASRSALSPFVACLGPAAAWGAHTQQQLLQQQPKQQKQQGAVAVAEAHKGGQEGALIDLSPDGELGAGATGQRGEDKQRQQQGAKAAMHGLDRIEGPEEVRAAADRLALAGMALLARATQHAGCLEVGCHGPGASVRSGSRSTCAPSGSGRTGKRLPALLPSVCRTQICITWTLGWFVTWYH